MVYNLEKILKVVRYLETEVAPSNKCHFAIGGSCVMAGQSEKDFDVFVYPRGSHFVNIKSVAEAIKALGWRLQYSNCIEGYPNSREDTSSVDKPYALFMTPTNHRVDMFFLSTKLPESSPFKMTCTTSPLPPTQSSSPVIQNLLKYLKKNNM